MALIWMDGFDHYGTDTARMTEGPYEQVDAAFTLSEVNPRTGARCLRRDNSAVDGRVLKNFGAVKPTVGAGAVFALSAMPSADYSYAVFSLVDSAESDQITIVVNEDGSVRALLGGVDGSEISASDPGAVNPVDYVHVEFAARVNSEIPEAGAVISTWDADTLTADGDTINLGFANNNFSACMSDDGLHILTFVQAGTFDRRIISFTLSEAFKSSTAVQDSGFTAIGTFSHSGSALSSDGTKAYLQCRGVGIKQFNLGTPYEGSTATEVFTISSSSSGRYGLFFTQDELSLFICDNVASQCRIARYALSIPGVLSSAVLDGTFDIPGEGDFGHSITGKPDGSRIFVGVPKSDQDLIYTIDLSDPNDISSASVVDTSGFIEGLAENEFFASRDGKYLYRLQPPSNLTRYTFQQLVQSGDSDGILEVRVNGVTVISISGSVTRSSEELGYSGITINCGSAVAHGVTTDVDDWYIWDDQGAWNNSFLGDRRCLLMKPNQDTNIADFDPSSGSFGYKMIDDDSPDDDSTYIIAEAYLQSGSPLTGTSEFEIENLPDGTSLISAVKVVTRASKTDSTSAEVFTSINSGVNSLSQSAHVLTTSYQYYSDLYEYDPTTIANITRDGFNSFSVSVTADDLDPGAVSPGEESPGPGSPGGSPTEPGLWTPALITTAAWYDISDSSTVTTVSGGISAVTDKSGNTRTASQSTAAQRPALISASQNGLDVARFDGINDNLTCINTNNIAQNVGAISIFAAYNRTGGDSIGILYNVSTGLDSGNIRSMLGYDTTSVAPWVAGRRLDSDSAQVHNAASASGWLVGSAEFDYSNAELYLSSNGTRSARGGFQTAGNTSNTPSVANAIGRLANAAANTNKLGGDVGEIIILQSIPTTDDRQRIEGYLAHKWGLETALPAGHPYKSSPPTV